MLYIIIFMPLQFGAPPVCHFSSGALWQLESRTPAGRAAGVAFEAGAVADQREVAAFLAAVALVALDAGGADAFETELGRIVFLRSRRDGEGAVERRRRSSAGAAVHYRQFAADIAARRAALHDRRNLGAVVIAGAAECRFGLALADRVGQQITWLDVGQVAAVEIGDRQLAEDVVEDRGRHLDRVVAFDNTRRLEPGERERLDELLERHAVLQTHRDRDREIVHQRAEGRAFLVHVDEDLGEPAVLVLAGPQIDLVATDRGLLRIALAPVRQPPALAALHHLFDDPLGDERCALRRRLRKDVGRPLLGLLVVAEEARGQWLRQLRAVAIKGGRL